MAANKAIRISKCVEVQKIFSALVEKNNHVVSELAEAFGYGVCHGLIYYKDSQHPFTAFIRYDFERQSPRLESVQVGTFVVPARGAGEALVARFLRGQKQASSPIQLRFVLSPALAGPPASENKL